MTYGELVDLYFARSAALQMYWTIYVLVIGGLLAFSSLRQRKDLITATLVAVLFALFAYKNLGAIADVITERNAVRTAIAEFPVTAPDANPGRIRSLIEPTLQNQSIAGIRVFHVACDILTLAALAAMELRRRRAATASA